MLTGSTAEHSPATLQITTSLCDTQLAGLCSSSWRSLSVAAACTITEKHTSYYTKPAHQHLPSHTQITLVSVYAHTILIRIPKYLLDLNWLSSLPAWDCTDRRLVMEWIWRGFDLSSSFDL